MAMAAHGMQEERQQSWRPALFAMLLGLAMVMVFVVLLVGPHLPLALAVGLAVSSMALVATGWIVAGPRL